MIAEEMECGFLGEIRKDELTWASGAEIYDWIAAGRITAVQVTDHFLDRVAILEPSLHAYRTLDVEGARAQAIRADTAQRNGKPLGPLHGVPISVKEHITIAGLPYTPLLAAEAVSKADRDSIAIERLRAAGAIIFGTTVMPGMGTAGGENSHDLTLHARNPWDLARVPGTSTAGGAASVAAAMTPISIGSDGAGSSRLPAAFCGILGFHPSFGRVPQVDYYNPVRPEEVTIGPLARDVRDIATVMQVIAGPDGRDVTSVGQDAPDYLGGLDQGVAGLKFAWTDDFGFGSLYAVEQTQRVIDTVRHAAMQFEKIGATVRTCAEDWEDYFPAFRSVTAAYGHPIKAASYQATMTPESFSTGMDIQQRNWERFNRILEANDLLLSPTVPFTAPTLEQWDRAWASAEGHRHGHYMPSYAAYTHMLNIFGWPAASVPCGFVDGLPVGLQIIGKPNREPLVMRAAAALLTSHPWVHRPAFAD